MREMGSIEVKRVTAADVKALQEIGRQTFFETFSGENTEDDMQKYLNEGFALEKLKKELNCPSSEFYFAQDEGGPVGYLKLNYGISQTEIQDREALEIERIYVVKEYHGKKVGQLLYEKAIQVGLALGASYVWLGVWEKNLRAISFYRKNGFVEFDKHIFRLGNDEQTDIMMKRRLKSE